MKVGLVGTAKGLLVYHFPKGQTPYIDSTHFVGFAVNMVFADERTNRWWAGLSHKHWGQKLHFSDDQGKTWQETALPTFGGAMLLNGKPAKLRQVWCMASGGNDRQDELWLGTDPGGLFHSKNNGQSFELVESLWNHSSRQVEGQWFGAGSDYPFIHSIVVDPHDADHVYIAVSCAGVFETLDGGKSWRPKNNGLVAAYLPNPKVEVGHDPHQLLMSPVDSSILWQQNHCGIFYTTDGGEEWVDVSNWDKLPNYGFSLAIDEEDPALAWVIPVESDEQRIAPDLKLQVFHTNDFGKSWQSDSLGLPDKHSFDIVLRQSFMKSGKTFLFGTTSGNLYYRDQIRGKWDCLSNTLTKVNSVFIN